MSVPVSIGPREGPARIKGAPREIAARNINELPGEREREGADSNAPLRLRMATH